MDEDLFLNFEEIGRYVMDKYGFSAGYTVIAALEVAKARWTVDDTTQYGELVKIMLRIGR